ncbi:tRNA threonylcarbamoyladenosine biosynthesis protein [candidate division MSBL1 archaeon SCGC-AAA259E17]|uniref:Threonylcarbamoyl-AMP synthase n=1 Tax=candidate division MSBL1 archaeon SCGC-AAA259E17 TaxID=1698263 RepID=A0A133UGA3_9EURY|nr:tRNA threonylcarbamoyladenosine biosynthesis protein [candidate division MSBL1 archaeon SCGC-AAA259E17]
MSRKVETTILKVDPKKIDTKKIRTAAKAIQEGKLVAFPTETVYGLGANALEEEAVSRIFEAKGRPADNPLIVHIAEEDSVNILAKHVPENAGKLMDKFWPGPMTLIMPKSDLVPGVTTANLDTVAIRMPSHPVARALIKEANLPIAAPSANLSGRPSPTSAKHVLDDLSGRIEVVIDGGKTGYGVESTVISLSESIPTVLRPGPLPVEELSKILGEVKISSIAKAETPEEISEAKSPGMKHEHYSPKSEVLVVEGTPPKRVTSKIQEMATKYDREEKKVGILATEETAEKYEVGTVKVVGKRRKPETVAENLFRILREFDDEGIDIILAEGLETAGIGLAIMNRLRKAAGYRILRTN